MLNNEDVRGWSRKRKRAERKRKLLNQKEEWGGVGREVTRENIVPLIIHVYLFEYINNISYVFI